MRSTWVWTAALLIAIASGSYGLFAYLTPEPLPPQIIYGNGHIEATEVDVAAEIAGRVTEVLVVEGRKVSKGDVLARLDDEEPQLRLDRARAEIEALMREADKTARQLEVARHHVTTAQSEFDRNRELSGRGTVSTQRLEVAENALIEAKGEEAALEAQQAAFKSRITAATRERDLINHQIGKTRIEAPVWGTVLVKAAEAGEFVQPGQTVAVLVDLSDIDLKVFIPEKDIGKVKLGAPARVRVDAFPTRPFDAQVARVDQQAQFTPRDIHMPEERTRTVFGITLGVANPEGVLKPGMPADAWILWNVDAGWPERLFVPQ